MEALIDADIVGYRCACTCENDTEPGIVLWRTNELIERILASVGADSYTLFLSGGENFRKKIDPTYKANRTQPKPKWLDTCKEFMVTNWGAKVTDGIEADDALGIAQRDDTIICSLDKDLLQIPGKHFQWEIEGTSVKGLKWKKEARLIDVTEEQGLKSFWTQTIVGDVSDNVFCLKGYGPAKATKILDPIFNREGETLEALDKLCYDTVSSYYDSVDRLHNNSKLLWIMRHEGDIWLDPQERAAKLAEVSK